MQQEQRNINYLSKSLVVKKNVINIRQKQYQSKVVLKDREKWNICSLRKEYSEKYSQGSNRERTTDEARALSQERVGDRIVSLLFRYSLQGNGPTPQHRLLGPYSGISVLASSMPVNTQLSDKSILISLEGQVLSDFGSS